MKILRGTLNDFDMYWKDASWAKLQFRKYIEEDNGEFWFAKVGETVVGRVYLFKLLADKYAADGVSRGYLCNLHVLKEYRKQSIGTALLTAMINRAKELNFMGLTLGVDENEISNVKLYSHLGFIEKVKKCTEDLICVQESGEPQPSPEFLLMMRRL